jgi:hypothetical protein
MTANVARRSEAALTVYILRVIEHAHKGEVVCFLTASRTPPGSSRESLISLSCSALPALLAKRGRNKSVRHQNLPPTLLQQYRHPKYQVLLSSDVDCRFSIDDVPTGELAKDGKTFISVEIGEHLVEAFTKDGIDKWKTVLVADKPQQKVILIELEQKRAARIAKEREIKALRDGIVADQLRVEVIAAQREKNAREQAALEAHRATAQKAKQAALDSLNAQRKDLLSRIDSLRLQVMTENNLAASDDGRAAAGERGYMFTANSTLPIAQLLGGFDQLGASFARDSAESHRAKARRLQYDIADLERQVRDLQEKEIEVRTTPSLGTSTADAGVPVDIRKYLANPQQSEVDRRLQQATESRAAQNGSGQQH